MPLKKSTHLVLTISLTSILVVLAMTMAVYTTSVKKRASEIIEDLKRVSAADSPADEFKSLQRKYGAALKAGSCVAERCYHEIGVNNGFMAKLHLADYAEMNTGFYFDHGVFFWAITNYRIAPKSGKSFVVHVQEDSCPGKCPAWFSLGVNPHGRRSVERWNGMVEFNANATDEQRQAARSFDFRCFSLFNRCTDISDILPGIWSRNSDGSVRCRFRTSGDAYNDWDEPGRNQ